MALDTPPVGTQSDSGTSAAESTNANLLNRQLSAVITALGDSSDATIALLNQIASAVTTSLIGGSTGATDNALLRASGATGRALQNSVAILSDAGVLGSLTGLVVGAASPVTIDGSVPALQVLGTTFATAGPAFGRWSNNAVGANFQLYKSRGATIGARATVANNDVIGNIFAYADDGSGDFNAALIRAVVDGTVSAGTIPMRWEFLTAPSGDAPIIRLTIDANGTSTFARQAGFARTTLTDASPIAWDARANQSAIVVLTSGVGATRQLAFPTNVQDGFTYILVVVQSSTGSNALTYAAGYKWPGGVAPVLSTANNAIDILTFVGGGSGTAMYGVAQKAFI